MWSPIEKRRVITKLEKELLTPGLSNPLFGGENLNNNERNSIQLVDWMLFLLT